MMDEQSNSGDRAFDLIAEEGRVARSARMLKPEETLQANQRTDIVERVTRFMELHGLTQKAVARECGISTTTISDVLRLQYAGKTSDAQLVKLHNWLELAARRENLLHKRTFVETSVAVEILQVAQLVAETCKMGVIFGPAQIGKSFTLAAIEGDQRLGDPVLIRVNESRLRPFQLCRFIAKRFELSPSGTFDVVFGQVVTRLAGTKRMLIFDEVERVHYKTLEMIRDLHDETGCPVLLAGKPMIYSKLGFRHVGDFSEVTDQLAARIIVRRDLTERTRGKNPKPLFSLEDIRKLIHRADLRIDVSKDAEKWLQSRASTLGTGGIGIALGALYLAHKIAYAKGETQITAVHLEAVGNLSMGEEDAEHVAEVIAESSGMRRVV